MKKCRSCDSKRISIYCSRCKDCCLKEGCKIKTQSALCKTHKTYLKSNPPQRSHFVSIANALIPLIIRNSTTQPVNKAPTPTVGTVQPIVVPIIQPPTQKSSTYKELVCYSDLSMEIYTNKTHTPKHDIIYSAMNPCTLERIELPVIIPCGHVFDLQHLHTTSFKRGHGTKELNEWEYDCTYCRCKLGDANRPMYIRGKFNVKGTVSYCTKFKEALDAYPSTLNFSYNESEGEFKPYDFSSVEVIED